MIQLRAAQPADAEGIVSLGRVVVPHTYGPIDPLLAERQLEQWWSPEAVADSLDRLPHWVCADGDRIVAVANLGEDQGRPVVWKLYVNPEQHGAGLGSALLREVEAHVEGPTLWLEYVGGNTAAAAFYERRGFVEDSRTPFADFPDIDWVWMRKTLRSTG